MNNQRKFLLIAAAVGIIAAFLPWVSVSAGMFGMSMGSVSVNGFHGVGILYCLAIVAAGIVAALGDQKALLDKNMRLVAILGGAVSIIALVIWFIDLKSSSAEGGMGVVSASVGYGFYLSAVAALAVTFIPFYIKGADDSFAGDLAKLKSSVQSIQTNIATPSTATNTSAPVTPAAPVAPPAAPDRMAELEKLIAWRAEGKITEEEFEDLKKKIL
jgi:hypothetical protein